MPTYQYACRNCEHRFEAVQGFDEDALQVCPNCGAEQLRKLFGNVGVVFKGSGFYRNDSRSGTGSGGSSKPKADTKADTSTSTSTNTSDSSSTSAAAASTPSAATS